MLGKQVLTARHYAKLTQQELADRLKTGQSSIARAETNGCGITFAERAVKACDSELMFHHVSIITKDGTRHTSFYAYK